MVGAVMLMTDGLTIASAAFHGFSREPVRGGGGGRREFDSSPLSTNILSLSSSPSTSTRPAANNEDNPQQSESFIFDKTSTQSYEQQFEKYRRDSRAGEDG